MSDKKRSEVEVMKSEKRKEVFSLERKTGLFIVGERSFIKTCNTKESGRTTGRTTEGPRV